VSNFIKSEELRNFYVSEIQELIKNYEPGNIENKKDVMEEIKRRDNEMREKTQAPTQMELLSALQNKTQECNTLKEQLSKILTIIKEKKLQNHFI
jgi:cytidylate kinase